MLAEIITIGDEILIGQVIDTNSAWMGQKLNEIGIAVKQITSISDHQEAILNGLTEALQHADIILITGGLGPTKDDITKHTLCKFFGAELVLNEDALENVKQIFARFNRPLIDVNIKQAEVPDNCVVIQNKNGTAPGMWFEYNGKIVVSMPGVPFEMMGMMEDYVLPALKKRFDVDNILHKTIITAGLGESFLAKEIEDIEDALPANIKLAYLPKLGQVRLRLSAIGTNKNLLLEQVENFSSQITARIPNHIIALEDISIQEAILKRLTENGLKLATAESCTGGYMAHLFTSIPGSSLAYVGGAVSYSNTLKQQMLGVKSQTLEQFGAVSEETVKEMALGALKNYGADYSIACSGIAGPDGGTEEKPVGTVWVAVANKHKVLAKKFQFGNKRMQNIERTAINGFYFLWRLMKGIE
ncbi:competence/damage-inducible protein A [Solitalea canadensis]|uniref:CinA-like protein n=1 Tax=Solitalea canadensis (strain ATCC 29591 / DSM 3403 / JCM 21819 / LMG 8368 / NBRC 15130 / NCIMB 12057 / USAM 9D) TaxID=929556 RepID=H8KQR8_SOLCM|nr:competence/damage-inducible protein A [Solitalea canadensis]AFD06939.1 competence/damage-inducible protein CinA-like protein [Solitalea canadensis DSM 3403]